MMCIQFRITAGIGSVTEIAGSSFGKGVMVQMV